MSNLIVVSFKTKEDQDAILNSAVEYFRDTVGLEVTEQGSCCANFRDKNDLGYVNVTLSQEGDEFEVKVESREYEYNVKTFVREFT